MNNGKYNTEEYKNKQNHKIDRLFGPIENHSKQCVNCGNEFTFVGRRQTKKYEKALYCSRSCSNSRKEWWNKDGNSYRSNSYRSVARRNHEFMCYICGFDKIVAIHHIDENKKNNDPSNLIPLCPNHHEMCHSRWKFEIEPYIKEWQNNFICK
jgi:hypothetical protein